MKYAHMTGVWGNCFDWRKHFAFRMVSTKARRKFGWPSKCLLLE